MIKIAIVQFPGSNCERETTLAVQRAQMEPVQFLWNEPVTKLLSCDGCIIVGGFSYEDRGRAGIIASLDPIMQTIAKMGEQGKLVLGICNGAQMLVENGLIPGVVNNKVVIALAANKRLQDGKILGTGFYNDWVHVKTKMNYPRNAFLNLLSPNQPIRIPTAHCEGRFVLAEGLYETLQRRNIGMMQYCDQTGTIQDGFPTNPNGSEYHLAALCNVAGNIMAIMPHPERTTNGDVIFESMRYYIEHYKPMVSSPLLFQPPEVKIPPFKPLQNSLQLIVELIITDNTAASIQKALQNLGIQVEVKRQIHWEIICDEETGHSYQNPLRHSSEGGNLAALKQKIIESCELFNPNKERLVDITPSNSTASFLVHDQEDLIGKHKCEILKNHFGIENIVSIKRGVLWHIHSQTNNSNEVIKAIMKNNTLFNPTAQQCCTFSSEQESKDSRAKIIAAAIDHCITETNLPGQKHVGKVRDIYDQGDRLVIVTTDRLTAFDRPITAIPFKGQVLNQVSVWWFDQTKHIVPNHILSVPNPNTVIAKKCTVFPIEFVVRGYITGSTETSLWTHYARGEREYCGHKLPEGLIKNQRLPQILLTPTTKSDEHDELISAEEILARGLMTKQDWDQVSKIALELFTFGSQLAAERGLILVDTKYEFGKDSEGNIVLIDEIHTPDSSRYWRASDYEERFAKCEQPDNFDKEFVRLWYRDNCDPYHDEVLPKAPEELIVKASERYMTMYEMITGNQFEMQPL